MKLHKYRHENRHENMAGNDYFLLISESTSCLASPYKNYFARIQFRSVYGIRASYKNTPRTKI